MQTHKPVSLRLDIVPPRQASHEASSIEGGQSTVLVGDGIQLVSFVPSGNGMVTKHVSPFHPT